MADNSKIADGSLGFFTQSGILKTKQQNQETAATLDRITNSSNQVAEQGGGITGDDNASRFESAFSSVTDRTNQTVSSISSVINTDLENLKAARTQLKDEIKALKDIKAAISSDDSGDGSSDLKKSVENYQNLQTKRRDLADKISEDNRAFLTDRVQGVRIGNKTEETFNIRAPQFERNSQQIDLADKKQITQAIKDKQAELSALRDQTKETKASQKTLVEVSNRVNSTLSSISNNTLRSFDSAAAVSQKIATQIAGGGLAEFENATLNKIRSDIGLKLIS